jgi:hypothetical protein
MLVYPVGALTDPQATTEAIHVADIGAESGDEKVLSADMTPRHF